MYRKNIFRILFSFAAFVLLIGCATQKAAIPMIAAVDLNPKVSSGQLIQKTDTFEVVFDSTLSMIYSYKGNTKLDQEKAIAKLMNDTIPNLKLKAAARSFRDGMSASLFPPMDYSKSALTKAIDSLDAIGLSPLDTTLDGARTDLQSQSGQLAVIAFSDGQDMEVSSTVAAAKRLKGAYGDRVCIYTVHIGENITGRELMQQVADAGQCGFMATGDSISTAEGMADFVKKIFLNTYVAQQRPEPEVKPVVKEKVAEAKPQAEAAPVVAAAEPVTIELNIQFATNKSNIRAQYYNEIKKAADYMVKYPDTKAVIEGHTDNIGKTAKNMKLSQDRANSVKKYLTDKFQIDSSRIEAIGYGPTKPIASNKTKEGRQKNRRVAAVFSNATK